MKKALLTNPAFRYVFEIFVIVFSVTISFFIQDVLNDREKIEHTKITKFIVAEGLAIID